MHIGLGESAIISPVEAAAVCQRLTLASK